MSVTFLTNEDKVTIDQELSKLSEQIENLSSGGTGSNKTALDTFLDNVDIDYAYDSATGANYTIIRVYKHKIDGSYQYPFVIAPNGTGSGTQSTLDMTTEKGYLLAINGGIFDDSVKPDGITIENGVVIVNAASVTHPDCKPLTISSDGTLDYAESDADANDLIANGIVSAICGFMPIIIDYVAVAETEWNSVSHYTENAQRQIIGQFGNGDYAIITCEGRGYQNSDGWTIAEAQAICQKHGLKFAYNLDGGGSAETMLGLKPINTIYDGVTGRVVPTFIVFNGGDTFEITSEDDGEVEAITYTDVEYLQVTGEQYIDTGISETEVLLGEYQILSEATNTSQGHICSSANTYMPFVKKVESDESNNVLVCCKYKNGAEILLPLDKASFYDNGGVIKATYSDSGVDVTMSGYDGTFATAAVGSTASANNNYYLFAYGGSVGATTYRFIGKIYYVDLYDVDGNALHKFKPVMRNSDGVYGLYDTVNNTFHRSDSGVDFTGGESI